MYVTILPIFFFVFPYNEIINVRNVAHCSYSQSGNMVLAFDIARWTFKRNGVLRVVEVKHSLVGETEPPTAYTIEQDVVYKIKIEELRNGEWGAFQNKDVQMEFFRIDPFVRMFLEPNADGEFFAKFKLPDVYGVFKFKVDYDRIGYTHLFSSTQVYINIFMCIFFLFPLTPESGS